VERMRGSEGSREFGTSGRMRARNERGIGSKGFQEVDTAALNRESSRNPPSGRPYADRPASWHSWCHHMHDADDAYAAVNNRCRTRAQRRCTRTTTMRRDESEAGYLHGPSPRLVGRNNFERRDCLLSTRDPVFLQSKSRVRQSSSASLRLRAANPSPHCENGSFICNS
jgi:hypothetical protein